MQHLKFKVSSDDDFRETYYVEAYNLMPISEIISFVLTVAQDDWGNTDDEGEELGIEDYSAIDEDEVLAHLSSPEYRSLFAATHLDKPSEEIIVVYKRFPGRKFDDTEYYLCVAELADNDNDVSALCSTEESTREQAITEAYNDCIYQLRKYFQTPGIMIAMGVFSIHLLTKEEYDMEVSSRELVFK